MNLLDNPLVWPSLEAELAPYRKYCQGIVLNAGSGQRQIQLGTRDLNFDIVPSNQPDVIADLHALPLKDDAVDTIVSIAVLEHTRYPWVVAAEFFRVLRPGGYGVIAVPFLQPQHACPHDYVRFTERGLIELMNYVGFEVIETGHVHHFGQTLAWQLWEYLKYNTPHKLLLPFWGLVINALSRGVFFKGNSPNTNNTHYIVVRKPGETTPDALAPAQAISRAATGDWYYPLLVCPESRQPLHVKEDMLVSEDGLHIYTVENHIPCLLPQSANL